MLFTSIEFIVFVAAVMAAYWLPPLRRLGASWQWGLLAVTSLVFYGWEDPHLLILLCCSIVFNFFAGRSIAKTLQSGLAPSRRTMGICIGANLLLLAVFKYAGLLGDLLLPGASHADLRAQLLSLIHI